MDPFGVSGELLHRGCNGATRNDQLLVSLRGRRVLMGSAWFQKRVKKKSESEAKKATWSCRPWLFFQEPIFVQVILQAWSSKPCTICMAKTWKSFLRGHKIFTRGRRHLWGWPKVRPVSMYTPKAKIYNIIDYYCFNYFNSILLYIIFISYYYFFDRIISAVKLFQACCSQPFTRIVC